MKQTLRYKKRTTRGRGRKVVGRPQLSRKNLDREIRKNQMVYSHYILKFVLVFIAGLVWFKLGISVGPVSTIPIGLLVGVLVVYLEQFKVGRQIEISLLCVSVILSYALPIGIVL